MPQNDLTKLEYFAAQGDTYSQLFLAQIYFKGSESIEVDIEKGFIWFKKAATDDKN